MRKLIRSLRRLERPTASVVVILVCAFALFSLAAPPSPAWAASPSVIGTDGASNWVYSDLLDVADKYEGGYAAFPSHDASGTGIYDDPHGGYDTTTNKCKVCHAVHRAEGAYFLLRADSQDDACDYCHIGGSAHSALTVYDLNAAGKYTTNGHTIGASSVVPDSSISQWAEDVALRSTDASGSLLIETVQVRAYDTARNAMYRFTRHHGHNEFGAGRSGYGKIGPLALRCMNCHQPHNASNQIWRPNTIDPYTGATSSTRSAGYKLLKLFPSGSITGSPNAYGYYEPGQVVATPETTLVAGLNYSTRTSAESTMQAFAGDAVYAQPLWVAQRIGPPAGEETGGHRDADTVNTGTLSVWCVDCHNLNIGGSTELSTVELGFKAHAERTHPVPFVGGFNGPGQCYSCHRSDLPRVNSGDPCSQCHYGSNSYRENRHDPTDAEYVDSDFPHSGEGDDYKLLGSYSVDVEGMSPTTIVDTITVGPDNLDAVCLRCHWVEGRFVEGSSTTSSEPHEVPEAYGDCLACHPELQLASADDGTQESTIQFASYDPRRRSTLFGAAYDPRRGSSLFGASYQLVSASYVYVPDVTDIHERVGCEVCHQAPVLTKDCGTCHADRIEPHGYESSQHVASPPSRLMLVIDNHDSAMEGSGAIYADCTGCHATELGKVHDGQCGTCHPTPYNTLDMWSGACQEGGCHSMFHTSVSDEHWFAVEQDLCGECHGSSWYPTQEDCWNCHRAYTSYDTYPPTTTSDVLTSYTGMARIDLAVKKGSLVSLGTTYYRLNGGTTQIGSEVLVTDPGDHQLEVWSVDQNGIAETSHKYITFPVVEDSTPPITTSDAQAEYYGRDAYIRLTATDNGTYGVKTTYYRLDGGPIQTGTTVRVPEPDNTKVTHTLEFWSEDHSGNVEAPNSATFTMIGGTATFRLTTGPMVEGEWVEWHIHKDGHSGAEVATIYYQGPFEGAVDDVLVDVRKDPYYVYVSWGDNSEPYDEHVFGHFDMSEPGTLVELP